MHAFYKVLQHMFTFTAVFAMNLHILWAWAAGCLWILPQSLVAWMNAFPHVPQLLHDHPQFWTCEAQQRERM